MTRKCAVYPRSYVHGSHFPMFCCGLHYNDVIMTKIASQITSLTTVFTQPFIQKQIKENIKAPRHWPLCGEFTGTGEFPAQRASYAENVSIWWRHHGTGLFYPYHWRLFLCHWVNNMIVAVLFKQPCHTNPQRTDNIGKIQGLRPANERRRCNVTPSLIGWAQT